jgi:hypothetical protein
MTTAVIAIAAVMAVFLDIGAKSVNFANRGGIFIAPLSTMIIINLYVVPSFSS